MQRRRFMDAIKEVAMREASEIANDLKFYTDPETDTFQEMTGWANACNEIRSQAILIKRSS